MSQVEQIGTAHATTCTGPEVRLIDALECAEFGAVEYAHDEVDCRVPGSTLSGNLVVSQARRGFRA
jgi:hypothetical protein